ncbi:UNVERIFIED_CONTAM: hypothetical protein Slati_3819700 [Sesamum latifolium]|uniref:Uncharacterized protein n=1 Tax=Sesamum latifolium TaxID=2727402 RepID=A0AAW2U4Z6_9LAMI
MLARCSTADKDDIHHRKKGACIGGYGQEVRPLLILTSHRGPPLEEAPEKEIWLLHMDGSATTQGSNVGIVITSPQGEYMEFAIRFEFKAFNNVAELKYSWYA